MNRRAHGHERPIEQQTLVSIDENREVEEYAAGWKISVGYKLELPGLRRGSVTTKKQPTVGALVTRKVAVLSPQSVTADPQTFFQTCPRGC